MSIDHIRYDLLTQDALRGVIRTVLADAAAKGLPGEHHFYVTFDTRAEGVRMSARLRASYPGEMTIVLQHQFWDLAVGEDDFDVGLAFNGIPERLHIPFKAVRAFMDPSVQFGLQFAVDAVDAELAGESVDVPTETPPVKGKPTEAQKTLPAEQAPAKKPPKKAGPQGAATSTVKPVPLSTPDKDAASGEVVSLDRFRKK